MLAPRARGLWFDPPTNLKYERMDPRKNVRLETGIPNLQITQFRPRWCLRPFTISYHGRITHVMYKRIEKNIQTCDGKVCWNLHLRCELHCFFVTSEKQYPRGINSV